MDVLRLKKIKRIFGHCFCAGLELREETFGGAVHYGVFCGRDDVIPRSTRYGPFSGKIVNTSEIKTNDDNSFMWEVGYVLSSLYGRSNLSFFLMTYFFTRDSIYAI